MWGLSDVCYDRFDGSEREGNANAFLDDILSSLNSEGIEDAIVDEDCFLSPECLQEVLTPPSQEKWKDFLSATNPAVVTIDSAKTVQWKLAQKEIEHTRANLMAELGVQTFQDVTIDAITMHCIGPESATGIFCARASTSARRLTSSSWALSFFKLHTKYQLPSCSILDPN